eukprot:gb/GFBE01019855.1/.p1 GENE.gb/GFBE01019855.1/~~gb/GFBE01019855.1/.p1  ORF type:complete len:429 (+),score=95.12 gb/GFBE01019855.1/:1-1287(+)
MGCAASTSTDVVLPVQPVVASDTKRKCLLLGSEAEHKVCRRSDYELFQQGQPGAAEPDADKTPIQLQKAGPDGHPCQVRVLDGAHDEVSSGRTSLRSSDVDMFSAFSLEEHMASATSDIQPWPEDDVLLHQLIEKAPSSHGLVILGQWKADKGFFAVKQIPNAWMGDNSMDFAEKSPHCLDNPWQDLAVLKMLNQRGFSHCCRLQGIFRDETHTFIATSLASEGDLFSWTTQNPEFGQKREEMMLPLVVQICSAVRDLHDMGLAHRDISVENILLTSSSRIVLIDFGMATVQRVCAPSQRCGKSLYRAPEVHSKVLYDTFEADVFAVGVTLFVMAANGYPWKSTKQGHSAQYDFIREHGFVAFLHTKQLSGHEETLFEAFSPELIELLDGLLQLDTEKRISLGEKCHEGKKRSVWDTDWVSAYFQALS